MGNVYSVPRNVKGETRLFVVFSIRSLLMTAAFGAVGAIIWFIFSMVGLGTIGIAIAILLALAGYAIATFPIPDSPIAGKFRKASGEMMWEIFYKSILFYKKKKLYVYRKGGEK